MNGEVAVDTFPGAVAAVDALRHALAEAGPSDHVIALAATFDESGSPVASVTLTTEGAYRLAEIIQAHR